MLGSVQRGQASKVEELYTQFKYNKDPAMKQLIEGMKRESDATSISQLGFNSSAVSNDAIQNFLG